MGMTMEMTMLMTMEKIIEMTMETTMGTTMVMTIPSNALTMHAEHKAAPTTDNRRYLGIKI